MSFKETKSNSPNLLEMTGDLDADQKSQLCGVIDCTLVKESSDDMASKQAFNFPSAFQVNVTKSSCRGDAAEDQHIESGGNFCQQGLGDHIPSQNRVPSCSSYSNDQPPNHDVGDILEANVESMKSLSLKSDNVSSAFPSSNPNGLKSRDMAFSAAPGDGSPFYERSQSAQKFDSSNFLGDILATNSSGKSHSTPESSSGLESTYASNNVRSQLMQDSDTLTSVNDNHMGGAPSYWNAVVNTQSDDFNSQPGISLSSLSPLLTNLLFQQSSNPPVSNNSTSQSNSSSSLANKRVFMNSQHQGIRPSLPKPVGWNQTTTQFDSAFTASSDSSSLFTSASGVPSSKSSGWMGPLSSQNSTSYPWSSTSSQQNSFKPSFSDGIAGFSSSAGGNCLRFGMNSSITNIGSNGFPKGNNTSNPASMYSMFPKRPSHRVMAHWQQQHMQQTPSSVLNKQHGTDFSNPGTLSVGGQESILSQKLSHGSFGSIVPGTGVSSISSALMSGNVEGLNADKYSNYPFDQHLYDLMKSIDSSGNSQSSLLEDLAAGVHGIDNFHGNLHSFSTMPQSRPGLMSGLQSQGLHGVSNAHSSLSAMASREEGYSRKVFVGGLPPDIDEEEITTAFRRFGALVVDWPHKTESKAYFPPKGYCFLLFQEEQSVQNLINACIVDEGKYYWCVSSPTMKDKPVQIRPWNLADSDFVMDGSQTLDPRKTIFVGGVPRPLRAIELALIMDRLYGGVCYAGIDIDPELKYPKGAGRVAFSNQQSYIAAISARFVQLQHNDIDKRVEVKPYVLDNQMCDECQGARCGGKFAQLFCANVACLQYYCEHCWSQIHSRPGRDFHRPLVKEGAERPRQALYRW